VPALDVVSKVGSLLQAVARHEPEGATTSGVSRESDVTRSTAHRLLHSLQRQGLVDRDEKTGLWVLGPELFLLGTASAPRYDVTAMAQPFVRQLALATGESSFFSVRRGAETVCLVREDGSFPLRSHVLHEGVRFPLGVASAGLAVLAFLSEREIATYLDVADLTGTFGTSHSREQLEDRLLETRKLGYAVNPGLLVEGSWGIGAAVFDSNSAPIGALSLTGVEHRFARSRRPELGKLLLRAAHQLSSTFALRTRPGD
jgi:DNA-binding IclR family transcriptional regulator